MSSSETQIVIIPSYNTGAALLERTLREALAHWPRVWLFIDGSNDDGVAQTGYGIRYQSRMNEGISFSANKFTKTGRCIILRTMNRIPLILFLGMVLLVSGNLAADGDDRGEEARAVELLGLHLAALGESISDASCVAVSFDEKRDFPFRRSTRHLSGQLLRDLERERFAFDYKNPRRFQLLYNDGDVWLVRGNRDPERVPEADDSLILFAALFNENAEALSKDWRLHADEGEYPARFQMTPKSPAAVQAYQKVVLVFSGNTLREVLVVRENKVEHHYTFNQPEPIDCRKLAAIFE